MASDETAAPVKRPDLECDIVMAGGVTSGIIYPGAVFEIAKRYVFRSIGGTSVGAIAAAITAAAEYGRLTGRNPDAFKQIAAMPASLGERASDGHSRLFHLFTPEPATRRLYAFIMPMFSDAPWPIRLVRMASKTLSTLPVAVAMATALVVGLVVMAATVDSADSRWLAWTFALVGGLGTLLLVGLAWAASTAAVLTKWWLPALKDNRYGICTGLGDPAGTSGTGRDRFLGLTNWLHAEVQRAAGRQVSDAPVTFGDLWGAPSKAGDATVDGLNVDPTRPRTIDLAMIASDISRNRTTQLPFLEMQSPLYVEEEVLRSYFPPAIVSWMLAHAWKSDPRIAHPKPVVRLPWPQNLPVVFGARMSLSFPILLSAVPLLTPDFWGKKNPTGKVALRRVWFSDGGLTSNFPIHFFDSPMPSRPTFCLNLVDFASGTEAAAAEQASAEDAEPVPTASGKAVADPNAPERQAAARPTTTPEGDPIPGDPRWTYISMVKGNRVQPVSFTDFEAGGLGSFLSTLLNTARFWSDNEMQTAPGTRDRVVNIGLLSDEGGLNLDMTQRVIAELDWRGKAAGQLIAARYDPLETTDPETGGPNSPSFANHRWVRYRNFMAAVEDLSRRFVLARRASDAAAEARGEKSLDDMIDGKAEPRPSYAAPSRSRPYYHMVTDGFEKLAIAMADARRRDEYATFDRTTDGHDRPVGAAPRPKMRFRLRPIVNDDPRLAHADLPPPFPPGGEGGTGNDGGPPSS